MEDMTTKPETWPKPPTHQSILGRMTERLTERRRIPPWGLQGGQSGLCGRNELDGQVLPAKIQFHAKAGQVLTIKTPGGGGYGLDLSNRR